MAFDFSKIRPKKKDISPVDPIELFQKLKVSDTGVNDLWLAQGDALRIWHGSRSKKDINIVLNTGAGKTLVGLLIAQSLVNETREKVLYACSSIQLVEQTAEKAKGYGLDVTTYYRGSFSNDLFARSLAPCITTYQALFNGKSRFFHEQLSAVVFDDSHAAEHLLRDHFSLHISKNEFHDVFISITALFKNYYERVGLSGSYSELEDQRSRSLFLVPPFEIKGQLGELLRILHDADFQDSPNTMFAWEHIKNHIDTCCVLLSGSEIVVTPPFVPTISLPYFRKEVRRVYLSATLSAPDAFARTFGKIPDEVVSPSTTAGECERLILFPAQIASDQEDTEIAKDLIRDKKALILVPSYARAVIWQDLTEPPPKDEVSRYVSKFKSNTGQAKLLLAARYDGVDLPGDTCRVMAIDDLPMGTGPLERYLWEQLGLANTLRSAIASRIVQSFGRISRGMSDHGVVILTGRRLVEWVLVPKNRAVLPPFLQKQIALGDVVSEQADTVADLINATYQSLTRDERWIEAYSEFMAEAEPEQLDVDTALLTKLARSEAEYGLFMWQREYENAVKTLTSTLDDAFTLSASTGAWHCLWLGAAYLFLGDNNAAQEMFARAHINHRNIPAVPKNIGAKEGEVTPEQFIKLAHHLRSSVDGSVSMPKHFDLNLAQLNGTGTARQTEEALRYLGQYLGLESSRPDNEFGTGPDVLWFLEGMPALCMEVKTDKKATTQYQKKEIGQLSDHIQWVKDNVNAREVIPIFVGPLVGATETSNPPEQYQVVELDQFKSLAEKLKATIVDATTEALPLTLICILTRLFTERKLIWPECLEGFDFHCLKNL
ncbi:MAG: DEAD/DEAH box helicase family protein [Desulfovibrionaceae bacterium]